MPIMARTSGGIYKAVSDIYDTQGNAISTVYDTQGNVVFKKNREVFFNTFTATKYNYLNVKDGATLNAGTPAMVAITDTNGNYIYNKNVKGKKISFNIYDYLSLDGGGSFYTDGYDAGLYFSKNGQYTSSYTTLIDSWVKINKLGSKSQSFTDVVIPQSKDPDNDILYLIFYGGFTNIGPATKSYGYFTAYARVSNGHIYT